MRAKASDAGLSQRVRTSSLSDWFYGRWPSVIIPVDSLEWKGRRVRWSAAGPGLRRQEASVSASAALDPPQIAVFKTNMRFMFHAMVTKLHSPWTLSRPRNR
ncbi:MAG: hypothetical protein HQL37_00005, partial [Alphaproteobacteria bacterium]|nr:hypothetical protein [Alphaproteobacteria bacterium]